MRHFYRSYWTSRAFPCGVRRHAFAGCSNDTGDQQTFQESRHSHRSGIFGARRPLRYLSYRLDLDAAQQRQVAAILDRLKIDREQARLDEKKTLSELATMVSSTPPSVDAFQQALAPRVDAARNLQTSAAKAMQELVDLLDSDQREELSQLIRSGAFRI
jgi:Spy/CpxP family protein refolding chaperone